MSDDVSAELKREVAEAARILREDGHAVRLAAIEDRLKKHFPDEEPEPDPDEPPDPDKPPAPPKKDPPAPPADDVKRRSRFSWWPEDKEPEA